MNSEVVEQFFRYDATPLGARSALAMSKVLANLTPERSAQMLEHAVELARDVGCWSDSREAVPEQFKGEESLLKGFLSGCDQREEHEDYLRKYPPVVWHGDWNMDLDGLRETQAVVARAPDAGGFLPGLLISWQGGDSEPGYSAPVSTLDEAIAQAEEGEAQWHRGDAESGDEGVTLLPRDRG